MTIIEALLLGLIQGLTEFLPVSSSGHLVIFQDLLGMNEPGVTLEIILHFGTLFSVIWVFRKDFFDLFAFINDKRQRHFLLMLLIGTIVTALIGLLFRGYVDYLFQSTLVVGFMLIVTGVILKLITTIKTGEKEIIEMNIKDAALVGLLQGLAIMPGISRSGSTILASLWCGLDRNSAIKYSFMLSAPVILGATILETRDLFLAGLDREMIIYYVAGGLVAFISGIFAIKTFIRLLTQSKFYYFSYYCWAVGSLVIIISLLRILK